MRAWPGLARPVGSFGESDLWTGNVGKAGHLPGSILKSEHSSAPGLG